MNWNNVKLIFTREMRDQLRDRRTLVLIAVVPVLLYPLMGMTIFQLSQFLRNEAAKVVVVGTEEITGPEWLPPLLSLEGFHPKLFDDPQERKTLQLAAAPQHDDSKNEEPIDPLSLETARQQLASGDVQVVLHFPPGFGERLRQTRQFLLDRRGDTSSPDYPAMLNVEVISNSANEKSRIAQMRVERVVARWRNQVMRNNLRASNLPINATRPFEVMPQDVARQDQRQAAMWSKILPFLLFLWALTGAFYPAVDVCAGEKERGTLETLLTSPAQRREIAWGKLLTVLTFSMLTALMNLGSLGVTGMFVLDKLNQVQVFTGDNALSLPHFSVLFWLSIALIPVSALFSALCLAFAAFARSTKEGQYYLMPLLVVIMPLMFLTMSPGVELTLGNSLIPVTGVVLLLRSVIEGQYTEVLRYLVPVVGVTLMCCLLAIRWVEELFSRESVLFRESERLDLGRWLVHLLRDRRDSPTLAQALFGIVLILVVQFFVNLALSAQSPAAMDFGFFTQTVFISQVVCIALPVLLLTLLFVNRRRSTLLLDKLPKASHLLAGAALALFAFPLGIQFAELVKDVYPITEEVEAQMQQIAGALDASPYPWLPYLLIAILPACCEELAFRGFILSGLRHTGHKWAAIGISAVAFGMVHFFLQQKISATAVGLLLGYLAVQTGSLLPCILFHAIYNSLAVTIGKLAEDPSGKANWLFSSQETLVFHPAVMGICVMAVALLLWWLHRIPYRRTAEEQLHELRERQLVGSS